MTDGPRFVAVLCAPDGTIREVVHESEDLGAAPGRLLPTLLHHSSFQKGMSFLAEANALGAAVDWELITERTHETWQFTAVASEGGLFVIGAPPQRDVEALFDELARINNEQANLLRSAVKTKEQLLTRRREEAFLYDELTRLNNELANAHRTLAKANAELRLLNDQKNELLGMAAHDLRNPLSASLGFLEFIAEEPGHLSPLQAELLGRVQSIARFQLALIDDILDLATIESGRLNLSLARVDLREAAAATAHVQQILAARKEITIEEDSGTTPVPVLADRSKLDQVLQNLLGNAIKFSPAGSRITLSLATAGGMGRLSVRDRGAGIPLEEQPHIFKPFAKGTVRGTAGERSTGLGLSIARRIVEGHGGRISFESIPGEGSIFTIEIPLA